MSYQETIQASAIRELTRKAQSILEDEGGDLAEAKRLLDRALEIIKAYRSRHESA